MNPEKLRYPFLHKSKLVEKVLSYPFQERQEQYKRILESSILFFNKEVPNALKRLIWNMLKFNPN